MSLHDYLRSDPQCDRLLEGAVLAVGPMLEDPDPGPTLDQVEAGLVKSLNLHRESLDMTPGRLAIGQ